MSILNDAAIDAAAQEVITEPEPFEEDFTEDPGDPQTLHVDFSFLRTPTGPGSIEEYIDHPLNSTGSRGLAQIIRGISGFAGSLDLAIIDITIGALQLAKERKTAAAPARPQGVNYEPIIKP